MNSRQTILLLTAAALLGAGGCSFISNLVNAGGADAAAFTVDLERYDVRRIDLVRVGGGEGICPGSAVTFKVTAEAVNKKKGKVENLETADPKAKASEARGKMDLTEFAFEVRGGKIESGVFTPSPDPFVALLGYDVKATYRLDKSKEVTRHYAPEYSCIAQVGGSGTAGNPGKAGGYGASNGGAGGAGGDGGSGGSGPRITAHVSIVQTPYYDRVGIVRLAGDVEGLTLFDLSAGVTIAAIGGPGGHGGPGGPGGEGAKPQGTGGPGGAGGDGGDGGDGGQVVVTLDERFPELGGLVRVDVSGGPPGEGGSGGRGGAGAPSYKPCGNCEYVPGGKAGPDGPSGRAGGAGRAGWADVTSGDVSVAFATLPSGVRLYNG